MTRHHLLLSALLFAFVPALGCSQMADNTATKSIAEGAIDINALLGTVTDAKSAEAAKGPLESAIASLKGMLPKSENATGNTAEASGGMAKLATDTLAKFGIDGSTVGTITSLLNNEAIAGVIGPALNQLKSLIPMQ